MGNLTGADQTILMKLLRECKRDTLRFGKTFFEKRFSREFDDGHYAIRDMIDGSGKYQCIMAPRGTGKTSIIKTLVTKKIVFHECTNVVYISASQKHSIKQTEEIKDALSDDKIVKVFGQFKPEGRDASWSKQQWETTSGVIVNPLGAGQQVRGLVHKDVRPDLIVVDDLEDDEAVRNEDRRRDLMEWFTSALMGTVDQSNPNTKFIVIGTLLHEDALLANIHESEYWESLKLEICDDNFNTKYPMFVSSEWCKKKYEEMRSAGNADGFYREYRNIVQDDANKLFRKEYFRYYEGEVPETAEVAILVDPAKTTGERSADTAIVVCAVDEITNRIYVIDAIGDRFHPDEVFRLILQLADDYNAGVIGVEVTGLNEYITHPLRDAMLARGRIHNLVEVHARGRKEDRIRPLSFYYQQGCIYHNRERTGKLEGQLLSFPLSKRFDLMDALAHLIELKDIGDRFWGDGSANEEAEMKELDDLLENDDFEPVDWRVI